MLDVNARQLRAFLAVARVGNITRAAETLGLTPSPVGRAIRELEEAVHEVLFLRDNRVTVMTEAADRVLPPVVAALALLDGLAGHDVVRLRVGVADDTSSETRESVLASAREVTGQRVEHASGEHDALLLDLQFGDIDLLVTDEPAHVPGLASVELNNAPPRQDHGDGRSRLYWRALDVKNISRIEGVVSAVGGANRAFRRRDSASHPVRNVSRGARKAARASTGAEIDVADVRVLVALARHRSLRAAAESLGLTASPVGRTVRELETRLGGPLLERDQHNLVPTRLLDSLLPDAVEMLSLLDSMAPGDAMLRVGFSSWSPVRYRDRLLAGAGAAGLPRIDMVEATQRELIAQLLHGEIDLMVHNAWRDLPGAAQQRLGVIRFHVFSADTPVTTEPIATLADLGDLTIIALPRVTAPALYKNLVQVVGVDRVHESTAEQLLTIDSRMRRTGAVMLAAGANDTALWHLLDRPGIVSVPLDDTVIGTLNVDAAWRSLDLVKAHQIELAFRTMQGPDNRVEML